MANNNPPKGRTRPSRLLNLKKASPAMKKISQENAESSAFLQLPSEIRNTIYEYALGGRTLHYTAYHHYMRVTICKQREEKLCQEGARRIHHKMPFCDGTLVGLNVALLRCSRQIYEEAALIPYTTNTFHIMEHDRSETLFKSLIPAQRRAITSLQISERISHYTGPDIKASRLRGLTGLRNLSVDIYPIHKHERNFDTEDLKRFEDNYKALNGNVRPTNVRVRIFGAKDYKVQELQQSAAELERILLDGPGRAKVKEEQKDRIKQEKEAWKEERKRVKDRDAAAAERAKRKREQNMDDEEKERHGKRQARGLRDLM